MVADRYRLYRGRECTCATWAGVIGIVCESGGSPCGALAATLLLS